MGMDAPPLETPRLLHERIRCACQQDNLLVWPAAWYPHQEEEVIDAECAGCGRSLLERTLPVGAVIIRYTPEAVPDGVARALGASVVDPFRGEHPTVAEGEPGSWSEPHEPSAAYVAWAAENSPAAPEPFMERSRIVQNIAVTAVLAVVMALLAVI
jgi:hypothetical protein